MGLYYGMQTGSLENGLLRLEYLKEGALRLVRLMFGRSEQNLFVELPDVGWDTPRGFYRLLGGHRFWVAPESIDLTYLTEPQEVAVEVIPGGVRLAQPVDLHCGLQKIIEVQLHPGEARFSLNHILVNHGPKTMRVAAWAISQFALGGIAALPQPNDKTDPGGYLPNRSLALWPYTRLNDPRLRWLENHLMINAGRVERPCKVGYSHPSGWEAYLLHGVLIRKQVQVLPGAAYPDLNSPLEMYIDHRFIELESLSPLSDLQPGEQICHSEHWSLQEAAGLADEAALAARLEEGAN